MARKKVQKSQTQIQNGQARQFTNDEFSDALWAFTSVLVNNFELEPEELQQLIQQFSQQYAYRRYIRRGYGFARWAAENMEAFERQQS